MLKKIAHWYLKIVETVCVFLLLLILSCMCIQISCRLLTIGQNFTEELSRLSFSLLIFLWLHAGCLYHKSRRRHGWETPDHGY